MTPHAWTRRRHQYACGVLGRRSSSLRHLSVPHSLIAVAAGAYYPACKPHQTLTTALRQFPLTDEQAEAMGQAWMKGVNSELAKRILRERPRWTISSNDM